MRVIVLQDPPLPRWEREGVRVEGGQGKSPLTRRYRAALSHKGRGEWFRTFCILLALVLSFSPLAAGLVAAQETSKTVPKDATEAEAALLNRLAKNGFLGDKKSLFLKGKTFTGAEVVEALVEIDQNLPSLQGNGTQPGATTSEADLKGLLDLERSRKDALWEKKVQVWTFEKRVKGMLDSIGKLAAGASPEKLKEDKPVPNEATQEEDADSNEKPVLAPTKIPAPLPTKTPAPEVTQAELDEVVDQLKDLGKKLDTLSIDTDKKLEKASKDAAEVERTAQENLEQLRILKKLVDQVQDNLTKTGERLETVAQKAAQKTLSDNELRQELTILHKDMRDNSQDISVLKQEMAKLEQKKTPKGQSPLDEALTSPWLAGGALLVGLAGLIVAVTK